jgi:hypothetical protein
MGGTPGEKPVAHPARKFLSAANQGLLFPYDWQP